MADQEKFYPGNSKQWWDDTPFVRRKPVDVQVGAHEDRGARQGVSQSRFFKDLSLGLRAKGQIRPLTKPEADQQMVEDWHWRALLDALGKP